MWCSGDGHYAPAGRWSAIAAPPVLGPLLFAAPTLRQTRISQVVRSTPLSLALILGQDVYKALELGVGCRARRDDDHAALDVVTLGAAQQQAQWSYIKELVLILMLNFGHDGRSLVRLIGPVGVGPS